MITVKQSFSQFLDLLYTMIIVPFKIFYVLGSPFIVAGGVSLITNPILQITVATIVILVWLMFFPLIMSIPPDREDF